MRATGAVFAHGVLPQHLRITATTDRKSWTPTQVLHTPAFAVHDEHNTVACLFYVDETQASEIAMSGLVLRVLLTYERLVET